MEGWRWRTASKTLEDRVAALKAAVQRLDQRIDAAERSKQSDIADVRSDIAMLRAEMTSGHSALMKDMAPVVLRLGAIEATLAQLPETISRTIA